ncbi:Flp pilus assembly protein TadG [Rhizobium sp. PP-F2F-G48]|uniref:TadE/TadG family type IV pilus assembly protein n=1 Tax=Rhizobium sp. PP-F2F-G48 TaxID=2135651 RepID=UPI00104A0B69|nr:TadE/TadG family type IV pilus assembly protein [Rhizobium sp. PP-F2F-G48]TCM54416.1 Flp pilus assembly protein TadG [Rhizobium sp. PP-F2F-G48]
MTLTKRDDDADLRTAPARRTLAGRFARDRKGAAAIEFAILVIPFMMVIFASIETFVAFTGEQILANATQTMARKIRTGLLPVNMSQTQFRSAFCSELTAMLSCSATEPGTPSKLLIDVRSYASFGDIPTAIPRKGTDLDTTGFTYAPGGPGSINLIRAYYRWTVVTDLVRPYVTNLRAAGTSMPNDYLMATTAAFMNEKY